LDLGGFRFTVGRVNEGGARDYGYGDPAHVHAVTQVGDDRFAYDANGNMTLRVEISPTQTMTYVQQFDLENRLAAVTATNGLAQTVTRFGYDGDGARVWQSTEEGTTIYVGEYYEEFLPGADLGGFPQTSEVSGPGLAVDRQPPATDPQTTISNPQTSRAPGLMAPLPLASTAPGEEPSLRPLQYPAISITQEGDLRVFLKRGATNNDHTVYLRVKHNDVWGGWQYISYTHGLGGGRVEVIPNIHVYPGDELDIRMHNHWDGGDYDYTVGHKVTGSYEGDGEEQLCGWKLGPGSPEPLNVTDLYHPQDTRISLTCWEDYTDDNFADLAVGIHYVPYPLAPTLTAPPDGLWQTSRTVNFTWTGNPGSGGAILEYQIEIPGVFTFPTLPSSLTHAFDQDYQSLQWHVRARNSYGWSPWSSYQTFGIDTEAPADWNDFNTTPPPNAAGWVRDRTPDASIQVRDVTAGLDVSTTQYCYSTDGGSTWSSWGLASCTGSDSTTGYQTITAHDVPFNQDSDVLNQVQFRIQDMTGWWLGVSKRNIVPVDAAKPSVFTGLGSGWNPGANPSAMDTLSDIATRTFYVDDWPRAWRSYSDLCSELNLTPDGRHTAWVEAQDNAGNYNSTANEPFDCDRTPPSATADDTCDYATSAWNVSAINVGDAGPSGVEGVRLYYRTGTSGGWTWYGDERTSAPYIWTFTPAGEGRYEFCARAGDHAGNWESPCDTGSGGDEERTIYDITDPVIGDLSVSPRAFSPNGDGRQDTTTITAQIVEANPATWEVTVLGTSPLASHSGTGASVSWTWGGSGSQGDGQYSVRIRATDAAGHTTTDDSLSVRLDTTPPAQPPVQWPDDVLEDWPEGQIYRTGQDRARIHGAWPQQADFVWVNGEQAEKIGVSPSQSLYRRTLTGLPLETELTVVVLAGDEAGNLSAPITRTVLYDPNEPVLGAWGPRGETGTARPLVWARFETPGSPVLSETVVITQDGVLNVTAQAVVTPGGFAYTPAAPLAEEALHSVAVEMADVTGNRGSGTWSFRVDGSTWLDVLAPPDGAVLDRLAIPVSGRTEAGNTVAGGVVDASGAFTLAHVSLVTGTNAISVSATDAWGHTATDVVTVTADTGRPAASVTAVPNPFSPDGDGVQDETVFELEAAAAVGLAGWALLIGGERLAGGSGPPPDAVTWDGGGKPDGAYPYALVVTASNGLSVTTGPQAVVVDTAPPDAPRITTPISPTDTGEASIWVAGTAEPQSTVTLQNGGTFTFTAGVDEAGDWGQLFPLNAGWNLLRATGSDGVQVSWEAKDTISSLGACSLKVEKDDGSQEKLSTSCEGSHIYTEAEPGQTCIVHLTATDNVGNRASAEATSGLPRVTKYFYHPSTKPVLSLSKDSGQASAPARWRARAEPGLTPATSYGILPADERKRADQSRGHAFRRTR
jgi:hypothetical protein